NDKISDLGNELRILLPQFHSEAVAAAIEDIWESGEFSVLGPLLTRFTKEELRIHFATRRIRNIPVRFPPAYSERVRDVIAAIRGRTPRRDSYPVDSITFFREAASSALAFERSTGEKLPLARDPKLDVLLDILNRNDSHVLVFC